MPRFTLKIPNVSVYDERGHIVGANQLSFEVEAIHVTDAHRAAGDRLTRALSILAWADRLPPKSPARTSFERLLDENLFPEQEPTAAGSPVDPGWAARRIPT